MPLNSKVIPTPLQKLTRLQPKTKNPVRKTPVYKRILQVSI